MDFTLDLPTAGRLLAALVIGGIIGSEREYRSKAAGFRTMTLICLGSATFTILSLRLGTGSSPDRIASNIVTGIGFLGAGAIFKDGITISGLTTATSIWVTASLGMAAGAGRLGLAAMGLGLALVVLAVFERLQELIDNIHQKRSYRFQFSHGQSSRTDLETTLRRFGVKFRLRQVMREEDIVSCLYDVWGSARVLGELSDFFVDARDMRVVEYST